MRNVRGKSQVNLEPLGLKEELDELIVKFKEASQANKPEDVCAFYADEFHLGTPVCWIVNDKKSNSKIAK